MSKYKIVITDYYYPNLDEELKVLSELGNDVEIVDCTKIVPGGMKEPEELIPYVQDADAVVVQFARITRKVIESMKHCKVIARYAIGVDTIDVVAATEHSIYVANVPDYCIDEVANTAIAHIMNGMRKIVYARDMLMENRFTMDAIRPMKRMKDATLCLLGFGRIARNLAEKMMLFVKDIVIYDPYFKEDKDFPQFRFMDLDQAISYADIISIHIPLNAETKNMISTGAFSKMKNGAIIVNTSRGGVIEEPALIEALDSGKIAYAGLDVISTENFAESRLLRHKNVTLTPHIGWCSEEATLELQRKTGENVVTALLYGRPKYHVN